MKYLKTCVAVMLSAAMLLSGCTSNTEPSSNEQPAAAEEAVSEDETTEEETPEKEASGDNNVVVAVNANLITLDPHAGRDSLSNAVMSLIFDSLMLYNEDYDLITNLAESYTVSDDALTYTFKLVEGVKFHDGEDFNADAVVANFDRIMDADLGLRQRNNLKDLREWNALDEYTVEFVLEVPYMPFLDKLVAIKFISPKAIEEYGEDKLPQNPVGTGPYKFVSWIDGEHCILETADEHFRANVQIDGITFRFVTENSTRVTMLETGEADLILPMPNEMVSTLEGNDDIDIIVIDSTVCRYVSMNQTKGPLADVRVRKAMNHAIDKEAYINVVRGGYGVPLQSSMSPLLPFHKGHDLYEYDVELAKELLAEAGYPDGFTVTLWGSNDSETVKGMQFINQQLSQVGITVDVVPMEEATLSDAVYKTTPETAEVELWYVSWSSIDVDNATRSTFNSNYFPPTGANTNYYENKDLDALMDQANQLTDREAQKEIYGEIQDMIWEDAVWMFLGVDQTVYAKGANIDGMYSIAGRYDFDNAVKN